MVFVMHKRRLILVHYQTRLLGELTVASLARNILVVDGALPAFTLVSGRLNSVDAGCPGHRSRTQRRVNASSGAAIFGPKSDLAQVVEGVHDKAFVNSVCQRFIEIAVPPFSLSFSLLLSATHLLHLVTMTCVSVGAERFFFLRLRQKYRCHTVMRR